MGWKDANTGEITVVTGTAAPYDQLAPIYDSSYLRPIDIAENTLLALLLEQTNLLDRRVLDLGCGTGFLLDLYPIPPDRYYGVDISPAMLDHARKKYPGHRFLNRTMHRLQRVPLLRHWPDLIVSLFSFAYAIPLETAVEAIWKTLLPGGQFAILTYAPRYRQRPSYIVNRRHIAPIPMRCLTQAEAEVLFRPFENVKITGLNAGGDLLSPLLPPQALAKYLLLERLLWLETHPDQAYLLWITGEKAVMASKKIDKNLVRLEDGELQVIDVPVGELQPNTYNPNRQSEHEFELLCTSMQDDGFTTPILVQRSTKMIVDGEHRWRAAQALGLDVVPVVFVEMTDEQMRIATLRHNRARGNEDIYLASAVIKDLEQMGVLDKAAASLLMDPREIQLFTRDLPAPDLERATDHLMSYEELKQHQEQEAQVTVVRNAQDSQSAAIESNIYTLSLVFTLEEGREILPVIGHNQTEGILKLCRLETESAS